MAAAKAGGPDGAIPKAAVAAPAHGPVAPAGGIGDGGGGPAAPPAAAPVAVGGGGIPALVPPVAPPVMGGVAGPGGPPPPAAVGAGPPPAVPHVPGTIGASIPRTNAPVNANQFVCHISFAKIRRILRHHFILLVLQCFSAPNAENVIERVGIATFRTYIVALCIRFRHALGSSLLNAINKERNNDYRAMAATVRIHLNQYTDILVDSIGARIISILKTIYLNLTIEPAVFSFLGSYNAATFLPTEQFRDDAGAAPPALEHGWRLLFSWSSQPATPAAMNGMMQDASPLLDYWNVAAHYGFPAPAGGIPPAHVMSALASRAQACFAKEKIVSFEKPLIKAGVSTSLAPFIRGYYRTGTVEEPGFLSFRGIIDSEDISDATLVDRFYLPLRGGVGNDDNCFPFIRDPGWAPYVCPTDPQLGHSYSENTLFSDIATYAGIMR